MIQKYWKSVSWILCHGIQETFYGMCVISVLFRSDDEDDDDWGGERLYNKNNPLFGNPVMLSKLVSSGNRSLETRTKNKM